MSHEIRFLVLSNLLYLQSTNPFIFSVHPFFLHFYVTFPVHFEAAVISEKVYVNVRTFCPQ